MGLYEKPKSDLSKTEDKRKMFILVTGTLLFVLVAAVTVIFLTTAPVYDVMTPEVVTWQISSHSQIRCADCHMEQGVGQIITEKLQGEKAFKKANEITDAACVRCHAIETRNFTLTGDLIIPHALHGEKGVLCVKCHSGVVHGNISGRKVSVGNSTTWTIEEGKKNMTPEFVRPDMDICVDCHLNPPKYGVQGVKTVTWACEACHKNINTPKNHRAPNWLRTHGLDAVGQLVGCVDCHDVGITVSETKPKLAADGTKNNKLKKGFLAKDVAWTNEFCIDCHSQKPKDHQNRMSWMPNHKNSAAAKGMKNCVACHTVMKPKAGEALKSPAKIVACNNCHWFSNK
jgi:nitrate/TMAO reductase-like tetraheme cytochrome c subunit